MSNTNPEALLPPGFRFHPTDEELILHYLKNRATSRPCPVTIIAEVDIYKFDPWDLPTMAMFGDREWYFFSPRDRKYPNGVRPNRAAASGYWKATGTDKPIVTTGGSGRSENIGVKKALVFYKGRPPKGVKTNWIMHEYRLVADSPTTAASVYKHPPPVKHHRGDSSMRLDDWVLCRIYRKSSHVVASPSDREHYHEDDFAVAEEEAYFSGLPSSAAGNNTTTTIDGLQQFNLMTLPKSASLTQLLEETDYSALSRLLADGSNTSEALGGAHDLGPLLGHAGFHQPLFFNINGGSGGGGGNGMINYSALPKLSQEESPARDLLGSSLKRQRTMAEEKSHNSTDTTTTTPQCNLLNQQQQFFNQQMLLNSHLRLQ